MTNRCDAISLWCDQFMYATRPFPKRIDVMRSVCGVPIQLFGRKAGPSSHPPLLWPMCNTTKDRTIMVGVIKKTAYNLSLSVSPHHSKVLRPFHYAVVPRSLLNSVTYLRKEGPAPNPTT